MQVLLGCCAGLDVHKKMLVACILRVQEDAQVYKQVRTFETTTPALLALLDWLVQHQVIQVAMESTGEYWRPIYNILEGHLSILLVNARHIKAVPGRKTDVKDAEWIAQLLQHGLLRASFVPPRDQRELRDLTRQRANLVAERADVVNRLQKVLEDANIKLGCVATNVMGVSGRAILEALLAQQADPVVLAELALGRLRQKREALEQALTGRVREHHRFLVSTHLAHIDFLDEQIEQFAHKIQEQMQAMSPPTPPQNPPSQPPPSQPDTPENPLSYQEAVQRMDDVPGLDVKVAQAILAETGTDMIRFASEGHLCSWAGVAPGNHESAGKRYSGKTPPGNRALRKALVQAAHGAVRKKGSYFGAFYQRLLVRRGKKRAILAVAHKLLVVIYHLLKYHRSYSELGADYLDTRNSERATQRLVRRLNALGYTVQLEPIRASAAA
jgi:transposase